MASLFGSGELFGGATLWACTHGAKRDRAVTVYQIDAFTHVTSYVVFHLCFGHRVTSNQIPIAL